MKNTTRLPALSRSARHPTFLPIRKFNQQARTIIPTMHKAILVLGLLALASGAMGQSTSLGTAISYQGRLDDNGGPASGTYSFRYRLLADPDGAAQVGPVIDLPSQGVVGGLLNAPLDFGPTAFTGDARWLEISVKPGGPGNVGEYTRLNPQPLPPGGSSQYARLAGEVLNGAITGPKLAPLAITSTHISDGAITGPKLSPASITRDTLADNAVTASKIDSAQVVKSLNGLRDQVTLAAGANIALTASGNTLTVSATGSGGGSGWSLAGNAIDPGQFIGTLGSQPFELRVNNSRALLLQANATSPNLVGGWHGNAVDAGVSGGTIAGGGAANVLGRTGTNRVADHFGTVGGGANNVAGLASGDFQDGWFATVGGGQFNRAEGVASTIGGGSENRASGNDTTVAGGWRNQAIGLRATVGGGQGNLAGDAYAVIAGGVNNRAEATGSVVGGGTGNAVRFAAGDSTIAGGNQNLIDTNALRSVISGGYSNVISVGSLRSTVSGGEANQIGAQAHGATIGGGYGSRIAGSAGFATIGGGDENFVRGTGGTVAGGFLNGVHEGQGAVGGGYHNIVNGYASTVAGGSENSAGSAVGGYGTVGGGYVNRALADYATVGGGYQNLSAAPGATVPGGEFNSARGKTSFAAGRRARAEHDGAFVWGDATDAEVASAVPNQFVARAAGGVAFFTSGSLTTGVKAEPGGNSWSATSDRNVKENFKPIDVRAVLDRVVHLPVTEWNLKTQDPSIRHVGPMAQDFHAAFGLGTDDRHISSSDADGVAYAAIQGLHQIVQEQRNALAAGASEIAALKDQIAALQKQALTHQLTFSRLEARFAAMEQAVAASPHAPAEPGANPDRARTPGTPAGAETN